MERRQASKGGVMFWIMFCWEIMGADIDVNVRLLDMYHLPKHYFRPNAPVWGNCIL